MFKKIKKNLRIICQFASMAISNGYIKGYFKGEIYTGKLKSFCVPGLNCYSCPGALGSCPLGALQNIGADPQYRFSLYVLGFLMIVGVLGGRFVCGWLCPFGLLQDLLFKIPFFKKFHKLWGEKFLGLLRYVFLLIFVIILPMFAVDMFGIGIPWFCKYVCPAGTIGAGIPLVLLNEFLHDAIGWLYAWKIIILIVTIIASIIIYRPFCRYICPLGAIYGLFNHVSILKHSVCKDKCIECRKCENACPMGIDVLKNPNSIACIRCNKCVDSCPTGALEVRFLGKSKNVVINPGIDNITNDDKTDSI